MHKAAVVDSEQAAIPASGHLSMPEPQWQQARLRADVIGPLAAQNTVGLAAADEAARRLSISRRQVYVLVTKWRNGTGVVTDVAAGRSNGGKGGSRLPEQVEQIIRETIRARYLDRQKRNITVVYREIRRVCLARGLAPPARNTVADRIDRLSPVEVARRRGGADTARPLQSAGGRPPPIDRVLEQVQIDHTVIDLIVVDSQHRRPIGRPFLTAGIDVFSRCIVGMTITLEAPSAVSVGLCLAHTVTDKRPWLEGIGVDADWPMSGKPQALYIDNANEFHSEALARGCEQHGIALAYRPLGQPHYGGIIERVIGTLMRRVHELPGTTFSRPAQRGDYDSQRKAVLTLNELEAWLALAVATYHGTVHRGLATTPAARWAEGTAHAAAPHVVANPTAFLVDFLPVIRRRLTRTGFVIDHVHYFADVLKPWISRRHGLDRFVLRRDPRDISRIWVLTPDRTDYVEVPYRALSHPAVSIWEHRAALAELKRRGAGQVDEATVFRMIEQMRTIADTAAATTKQARRAVERRRTTPSRNTTRATPAPPELPASSAPLIRDGDDGPAPRWYPEIEQW